MSRIRSIHPGLWTDERFVSVSPFARLMFMGILNECDDGGVFEWSPLKLKMRLLPADNVNAGELLDELSNAGSVMAYEIDGKMYGAVRNFCKFQRPKKPTYPNPRLPTVDAYTGLSSEPVTHQLPTPSEIAPQMEDGGGNKEEEKKNYKFRGRVVRLTARDFDRWQKSFPNLDLAAVLEGRDTYLSEQPANIQAKWFQSTATWLANQNQKWRAVQHPPPSDEMALPC